MVVVEMQSKVIRDNKDWKAEYVGRGVMCQRWADISFHAAEWLGTQVPGPHGDVEQRGEARKGMAKN